MIERHALGVTMRTSNPAFAAVWDRVVADTLSREQAWVAGLRLMGVKAAHPDDGWVDREPGREAVQPEYPQFNDGVAAGDLIALGWPGRPTRIVRVVKVEVVGWLYRRTVWRLA